jgi:alpha-galactosidase
MNPGQVTDSKNLPTAHAVELKESLDAEGFPKAASWERAASLQFDRNWRGEDADPGRATEVRVLWNKDSLFLRFQCRYRELFLFSDARADGWRDQLWDRDVAEAFLQPDSSDPLVYKELEISPNGFWIDLNISHGEREEMRSGLRRRVVQDGKASTWTAELAVPMRSLTPAFDPQKSWRVNFYRVEGAKEPRFYSAWSPTLSARPNFHVPAAFGHLVFR